MSIQDQNLPSAIAILSEFGDAEFVAYNLFAPIQQRMVNSDLRQAMINQLAISGRNFQFASVCIDFLEKWLESPDERLIFDDLLFSLSAQPDTHPEIKRISASKTGQSGNYTDDQNRVRELLSSSDPDIVLGALKATKRFLRSSGITESERQQWSDEIFVIIQKFSANDRVQKLAVSILGYTQTEQARSYLLSEFDKQISQKGQTDPTIVYSLSHCADLHIFQQLMNKYPFEQEFGSLLTLHSFVKENKDLTHIAGEDEHPASLIAWLRAVRIVPDIFEATDKDRIKVLLRHPEENVRLEAVKTLRQVLNRTEENTVFAEHYKSETSAQIRQLIQFYIGRL